MWAPCVLPGPGRSPNGPNEATPLFHDGVLFVHSFGDKVQALDAATGDLLWQYARRLPNGVMPTWKRSISLYGDRVYVPTSDAHIVALDAKTGNVVWDKQIVDPKSGLAMTGGTLVAKGKVMVGTTGQGPGGNVIVGLDARTGEEAWRFYTIARPGDPADSWNGLPVEKRSGGSVWVPGSYDPTLNLAFFGPAPTYDTGPLRNRASQNVRNDALYTNATVALNPDTGKLVWYYQHLPNDQWDFDWAFERHVVKLPVRGSTRTVIVTAGKEAIFDAVEAEGGEYLFSMDLGLQNVVKSINPRTGVKTIDESLVPGDGQTKLVCPHAGAAKSWLPSSYDPSTKLLYIPLVESCMDLTPVGAGERGGLSTGVRFTLRPPPNSDGKYGRVQAINLETQKVAWITRQRAPETAGVTRHGRGPRVCRLAGQGVCRLRFGDGKGAVADAAERRPQQRTDFVFSERQAICSTHCWQRGAAGRDFHSPCAGDQESAGAGRSTVGVRTTRALTNDQRPTTH